MKLLSTSLLMALAVPAFGDIFTLKDGTKLDAVILEKTLEQYVLEVNVTRTIKERRTIKREDVESIERVSEADLAFEGMEKLTPAPPLLSVKGYDERIKVLKDFLGEHKLTTAGTKATKMVSELEEERARIAAGDLKMADGKFITAEERVSDVIAVESQILRQEFETLVAAKSYTAAFRKYDELEKKYFGSQALRDAVPEMAKLVTIYGKLIARELKGFDAREEVRIESIKKLSDSDYARALAADKAHAAQFEKLWEAEEKAGERWLSIDSKSAESMKSALATLQQELARLSEVQKDLAEMPETGALFSKGWEAAGKKDAETLEPILDKMEAAGLDESYLNQLIDRYDPTINNPVEAEAGDEDETEPTE